MKNFPDMEPYGEAPERPAKVEIELAYDGHIKSIEVNYTREDSGDTTTKHTVTYYPKPEDQQAALKHIEHIFNPPRVDLEQAPENMTFEEFRRECEFFLQPDECDAYKPIELEGHIIECNIDRCPLLHVLKRMSERNKK